MKALIFLGPSLPLTEARSILDAVYLPPIRQADLVSALELYRPDVVGIIDGATTELQAVWHKEIMYALAQGVKVYGAGGIGALRAVETDAYGTVGVGEVYRMFKSGELNDDDEVALRFEQAGNEYRKLSEPMVNIRKTLQRAAEKGIIDQAGADALIASAKSLHYPQRTFTAIFRQAASEGLIPGSLATLQRFVNRSYVDIQRRDAVRLLETIRDDPGTQVTPSRAFRFQKGMLHQLLYERDRRVRHGETEVSLHAIASHAALHCPDFAEISFHAMNRALVQFLADLLGIEASKEEIHRETQRFLTRHRIDGEEACAEWLAANDLNQEEFAQLMRQLARCRRLHRWLNMKNLVQGNIKIVLDELRLRNRYRETAVEASTCEAIFAAQHPHFRGLDLDFDDIPSLLIEHLRATGIRWDTHYIDWATDSGLSCVSLMLELIKSQVTRRQKVEAARAAANLFDDADSGDAGEQQD